MSDVQDIKEASVAVVALVKEIQVIAKDGLTPADAGALVLKFATDDAFRTKFRLAFEGLSTIPAEFKEIDMVGGLEIITAVIAELRS
jgi:hypothetical protein